MTLLMNTETLLLLMLLLLFADGWSSRLERAEGGVRREGRADARAVRRRHAHDAHAHCVVGVGVEIAQAERARVASVDLAVVAAATVVSTVAATPQRLQLQTILE